MRTGFGSTNSATGTPSRTAAIPWRLWSEEANWHMTSPVRRRARNTRHFAPSTR